MAGKSDLLQESKTMSMSKLCKLLDVPRSTLYYQPRQKQGPKRDGILENLIYSIISSLPTFGIRRV
ncbi:helix-turn-helix domain-containing protein [Poriferisphaera sp. WC338]|uniref:helix-turn-helix domain-containing protein n=1 Tax=Poriferisphaera sp. WC338 TaxID=3425129 RepID=UPI003D8132F0